MKKITLLLIIALFSFQMNAQSKVGTIDVDYILSKMPELEKITADIQTYGTSLDTEIQAQLTNYQGLVLVGFERVTRPKVHAAHRDSLRAHHS